MQLDDETATSARRLRAEIAELGLVLPGSLSRRYTRCGSPGCHCHDDPPALHGPYWWWTRKVGAKTVTRLLSDDQAEDYAPFFEDMRRLRRLVSELESLAVSVFERDPRSRRRPGGRRPATSSEAGT